MIRRNENIKRLVAMAMAATVTTGLLASFPQVAYAGDTLPYEGESAKGENQPYAHGYRVYDIKEWSPETDVFGPYMRAQVPLQERNEAFAATQANPELDPSTEFFSLSGDYGNAFFDSYQSTNEFSQYLFNFWQYTDYYGSWHGTPTAEVPEELYDANASWEYRYFEFGILNLPNPAYTNAAHKNGALSLGCIFLPREGQYHSPMLEKDENGNFPVADKLAEMCEYYGFDGYFINQEESIELEEVDLYKEFMVYLREKGVYVQWYDSIVDTTGALAYENEFNEDNDSFIKDKNFGNEEDNYRIADSIFLNYWWNHDMLKSSKETAEDLGVDPKTTVFAGIEGGGDRFNQKYDLRDNLDENGQPMNSIAMIGGEFVHDGLDEDLGDWTQLRRQDDDYQWMTVDRERMWYSGVNQDPTEVVRDSSYEREEIGVTETTKWDGVSAYITERSVINGTNFITNFNTGHGLDYMINGEKSNDEEWSNINIQDILPTWQWWIDTDGSRLGVEFDYGTEYTKDTEDTYTQIGAYNGGSSLVINGKLDSENLLRLYKTDLDVNKDSKASITFQKISEDTTSKMKLALIFKDDAENVVYLDIDNSTNKSNGWITSKVDLSEFAGRQIATIGLAFESSETVNDYQINIGQLSVTDGTAAKPEAPTGFKITSAISDTKELFVEWDLDDYDTVKQYNLYAVDKDGNDMYLGGSYDSAYYIKNIPTDTVTLKLTAVGADGTESEAATTNYDFTSKVSNIKTEENMGYIDVTWDNPDVDFESIKLEVNFVYSDKTESFETTVNKGETSARIIVPVGDGSRYTLSISTVNYDGTVNQSVDYNSRVADGYSKPYDGEAILLPESKVKLTTPSSIDWWHMYIYEDGKAITQTTNGTEYDYYIRGKNSIKSIPVSGSGKLTIVLEDYRGNMSEPIEVVYGKDSVKAGEITSEHFADDILLNFVKENIGTTVDEVKNYTGKLDLSNLDITNISGLALFENVEEIDLSNTNIRTIEKQSFSGAVKKISLKDCSELVKVEKNAFTHAVNLKELDITGCNALEILSANNTTLEKLTYGDVETFKNLISLDLSSSRFDMSEGTLERVLADAIDAQNVDSEDIVEKANEKSNLAIGSEIVSTTNPDAYRLVDGVQDVSGYWVIMKAGDEVVIDLGKEEVIYNWEFVNYNSRSYGVKDLEILVSNDGENFETLSRVNESTKYHRAEVENPTAYRYYKLIAHELGTSNGHSYEFKLFGYGDVIYKAGSKYNNQRPVAYQNEIPNNVTIDMVREVEKLSNKLDITSYLTSYSTINGADFLSLVGEDFVDPNYDLYKETALSDSLYITITDRDGNTEITNMIDISKVNTYTANIVEFNTPDYNGKTIATITVNVVNPADTNHLEIALEMIKSLNKEHYTVDSWNNLQKAVAVAEGVLSNEMATQEEIDSAFTGLIEAKDNLEYAVDKTALSLMIDVARELDLTDLTPSSVEALQVAISNAEKVLANENATQEEVNKASQELVDAINNLVEIIDNSRLVQLVEAAEGLTESKYTASTWANLQLALEDAKEVVANKDATAVDVKEAFDKLSNSMVKLTLKSNKVALERIISIGNSILNNSDKYVPSTIEGLDKLIKDAEVILNNNEATQNEVDEIVKELTEKIGNTREKADKTKLITTVTAAKEYDLSLYTEESTAPLKELLGKAEAVLSDDEVEQATIDALQKGIESALMNLVKVDNIEDVIPDEDGNEGDNENNNDSGSGSNTGNGSDNSNVNNGSGSAGGNNSSNNGQNNSNKGQNDKLPQTGGVSMSIPLIGGLMAILGGVKLRKKSR